MCHMRPLLIPLITALSLAPLCAAAQSVALAGILGSKALLVVDGGAPRSVAVGQVHEGVRVLAVGRTEATIEVAGTTRVLYLGETPVKLGDAAPVEPPRLTLRADSRGHFIQTGHINGRSMQYMVDTGASSVAIGRSEAKRLGIKTDENQTVAMSTANGTAKGYRVRLDSVRLGPLELRGVDAVITPQDMPYVLLGNSFLRAFDMHRSGNLMVLQGK